jgi:hypothetical protein
LVRTVADGAKLPFAGMSVEKRCLYQLRGRKGVVELIPMNDLVETKIEGVPTSPPAPLKKPNCPVEPANSDEVANAAGVAVAPVRSPITVFAPMVGNMESVSPCPCA